MTAKRGAVHLGVLLAALLIATSSTAGGEPLSSFAHPRTVEPPARIEIEARGEVWVVLATQVPETGGTFLEYADGEFIRLEEWEVSGGMLYRDRDEGQNLTQYALDVTGPSFRFLVVNMTLTRLWLQAFYRDLPLQVWLDAPQAIYIDIEEPYAIATGKSLTRDKLRFHAGISGPIQGELFSYDLVSLGSGQDLTAGGAPLYYLTLNSTSWPALLELSTTIEPVPQGDGGLMLWVVVIAIPAAVLLLLILAAGRRRGRPSKRDSQDRGSTRRTGRHP